MQSQQGAAPISGEARPQAPGPGPGPGPGAWGRVFVGGITRWTWWAWWWSRPSSSHVLTDCLWPRAVGPLGGKPRRQFHTSLESSVIINRSKSALSLAGSGSSLLVVRTLTNANPRLPDPPKCHNGGGSSAADQGCDECVLLRKRPTFLMLFTYVRQTWTKLTNPILPEHTCGNEKHIAAVRTNK